MTYLEILKLESEKTVRPLAVHLAKLVKNLAGIRHRAAAEDEKVVRLVEDVARLEAAAAEALGGSTNDCERFKTSIKKLTVRLATSREVVELFKKIIPTAQREIDEAREKLGQAFAALVVASRAGCEAEMARLLDAVIGEHDGFVAAIAELGRDFGTSFRGEPPKAYSARLDSVKHRVSGGPTGRWLEFLRAPAAAVTVPAAAVLAQPARVESTPSAAIGESVTRDGPQAPEGRYLLTGDVVAPTPVEPPPEAAPDIQLTIHDNIVLGEGWCSVCGGVTNHWWGPELFVQGTLTKVCHDCGERLNPALMATLREMHRRFDEDHPRLGLDIGEELIPDPDGNEEADEADAEAPLADGKDIPKIAADSA